MTATRSEMPSAGSAEQETQLVESLALARAGLRAAAEAWNERLRWLRAHAEELFERRQRDIFRADMKAWRADPFASNGIFGTTALSAAWLKDFWAGVFAGLTSPLGITYEQAKDIVTTAGGDWRADRIDAVRGCLMGYFLAISPKPEAALRHWVADSLGLFESRRTNGRKRTRLTESGQPKGFETSEDATEFETVLARARHFLTTAPKPEKARAGLYVIAADEMKVWPEQAERLKKLYEAELARCAEGFGCETLGSAADLRETRRIRRELARAERRVEQIERRLAALRRKSERKPVRNRLRVASADVAVQTPSQSSALRMESETSRGEPASDLSPGNFEIDESNESQPASSGIRNETLSVRPASDDSPGGPHSRITRRPDPAILAKNWRTKHEKKPGKSRNMTSAAR